MKDETTRHLLPRFVLSAELERQQTVVVCDLVLETGRPVRSAADQLWSMRDESYLRGIPAIGRNVTGAIPFTIPHVHGV